MGDAEKLIVEKYTGAVEALTAAATATNDFKNLSVLKYFDVGSLKKSLDQFSLVLGEASDNHPQKKPRKQRAKKAAKKEDVAPVEANDKEDEEF